MPKFEDTWNRVQKKRDQQVQEQVLNKKGQPTKKTQTVTKKVTIKPPKPWKLSFFSNQEQQQILDVSQRFWTRYESMKLQFTSRIVKEASWGAPWYSLRATLSDIITNQWNCAHYYGAISNFRRSLVYKILGDEKERALHLSKFKNENEMYCQFDSNKHLSFEQIGRKVYASNKEYLGVKPLDTGWYSDFDFSEIKKEFVKQLRLHKPHVEKAFEEYEYKKENEEEYKKISADSEEKKIEAIDLNKVGKVTVSRPKPQVPQALLDIVPDLSEEFNPKSSIAPKKKSKKPKGTSPSESMEEFKFDAPKGRLVKPRAVSNTKRSVISDEEEVEHAETEKIIEKPPVEKPQLPDLKPRQPSAIPAKGRGDKTSVPGQVAKTASDADKNKKAQSTNR